MGSALSTVAEKIFGALGNTIAAPFSKSCEDECGEWDGICFIQNSCGASLFRLFKASVLTITTVVVLYLLLWKTGLVKCLVKRSCKLSWKAVGGTFRALGGACDCLCHRLVDTTRVYRGRRRDVEMGWGSDTDWSGSIASSVGSSSSRKRGRSPVSVRERRRRKDRLLQQPLRVTSNKKMISKDRCPAKRSRTERSLDYGNHHRVTGQRRAEVSSSQHVPGLTRHDHGRGY